jgi:hypothetical protein
MGRESVIWVGPYGIDFYYDVKPKVTKSNQK